VSLENKNWDVDE